MSSYSVTEYLKKVQIKENPRYNSKEFREQVIAEGEHAYHLANFYEAYEKKCIMIVNPKKHREFKQIKKSLEQHFVMLYDDEPLETYELKYSKKNMQVLLTIRCEMIVNNEGDKVTNKSKLLAQLFTLYQDNFIEVEDGKYIKMIFTIKLYEEIFIEEDDIALQELAAKCKVRMSYDMKKYRKEEGI